MQIATFTLLLLLVVIPAESQDDPCEHQSGNVPMRECYSSHNAQLTREADLLVDKIASQLRDGARGYDAVVGGALRQAASNVTESQRSWKAYRKQSCSALLNYFTTGSGAETAYQKCEFELAQERVKSLKGWFPKEASHD